ncbi:MAG: M48 family metallopeptidase [Burkholderiales bacterium]
MNFARLVIVVLLTASLAACKNTPVTGRKQLLIVPESQAIDASKQAYTETLTPIQKKGQLNTDPALKARVDRITSRLIPPAIKYRPETEAWEWQVNVIDDPKTLNAWCMAGGRMAIYTGIIQQLKLTDDEIAQIMGHEIAHALAKHTAERMSVAAGSQALLEIGSILLGGKGTGGQLTLQAAAVATTVGVQLPNSRTQESEADRIGIELAARGGYHPEASVTLWKKMVEATGGKGKTDFLSTHPAGEKRIEALAHLVAQMMPLYEDRSERAVYKFKSPSSK